MALQMQAPDADATDWAQIASCTARWPPSTRRRWSSSTTRSPSAWPRGPPRAWRCSSRFSTIRRFERDQPLHAADAELLRRIVSTVRRLALRGLPGRERRRESTRRADRGLPVRLPCLRRAGRDRRGAGAHATRPAAAGTARAAGAAPDDRRRGMRVGGVGDVLGDGGHDLVGRWRDHRLPGVRAPAPAPRQRVVLLLHDESQQTGLRGSRRGRLSRAASAARARCGREADRLY
jgi:hypothetical protein